nr:AraC family transcriptional regulator [Butyrivibrio sp.]
MFEGISLSKIQYSDNRTVSSLENVKVGEILLSDSSAVEEGMIYLKDCSYRLDGISRLCPQFPISDYARNNLFFLQSFSFWESGMSYYTKRKNLDSYLIVVTYSGHGKIDYLGQTFSLEEGDIFIIDCKEPHFYCSDGDSWYHSDLHISGNIIHDIYKEFLPKHGFCFHLNSWSEYQSHLEGLLKAYISAGPYRELQISSKINSLLIYLLTQTPTYSMIHEAMPDQLKYLIHYINNNYANNLSLEYLSDFSGFSKYHLCRIFKKYTGYTINNYITRLRIERAKDLLKTTSLPANKICIMLGIEDTNYF